jgi:ribonuclease P protein component
MQRRFRLQHASEFQRVRRDGKTHAHPLLVVVVAPSGELWPRIGISASRALGTAVHRNRARRRLRAALRPLLPALRPGYDVVISARRPLLQAPWAEVCQALQAVLQRAGCMAGRD